ncbi:MAG: cyclic nucleotide-binding domain-containing protein [Cellvibrionaceae bacterium]
MKITPAQDFNRSTLEALLSAIPFYKAVKAADEAQFELLLRHSKVIYCDPGSVLLSKGDIARSLYFLIKGQLSVYSGSETSDEYFLNHITPGEVFGDVAMLLNQSRNATILAGGGSRGVVVFSTEFSAFGPLEDCSLLSLESKLLFYRNTVLSLRWKLEVYSTSHPESPAAGQQRKVKLYTGEKNTLEELKALHVEGVALAKLLQAWNEEASSSELPALDKGGVDIAPGVAAQF